MMGIRGKSTLLISAFLLALLFTFSSAAQEGRKERPSMGLKSHREHDHHLAHHSHVDTQDSSKHVSKSIQSAFLSRISQETSKSKIEKGDLVQLNSKEIVSSKTKITHGAHSQKISSSESLSFVSFEPSASAKLFASTLRRDTEAYTKECVEAANSADYQSFLDQHDKARKCTEPVQDKKNRNKFTFSCPVDQSWKTACSRAHGKICNSIFEVTTSGTVVKADAPMCVPEVCKQNDIRDLVTQIESRFPSYKVSISCDRQSPKTLVIVLIVLACSTIVIVAGVVGWIVYKKRFANQYSTPSNGAFSEYSELSQYENEANGEKDSSLGIALESSDDIGLKKSTIN